MSGGFQKLKNLSGTLDKGDMLGLVSSFPVQMQDAWERGSEFARGLKTSSFSNIVVCGMGGSAIGGDMVRSFLGDRLKVPLIVNRGYDIPPSLVRGGFFVFSSYSGNTAETLAAYDRVRERGAPYLAITSGGELEARCAADGRPVCKIPGGMPPRAAIAYSLFPLLQALAALGATELRAEDFTRAKETVVETCRDYLSEGASNRAAGLAAELQGKVPFIYSCNGLFEAVARRWSTQLNENSKVLAHFAVFPEMSHNEIVGWREDDPVRDRVFVVLLQDEEDHGQSRRQADIAMEIIEPLCAGVARVSGLGVGRLSRLLSTMLLGDFVSVYLAYLNGVDPTPVENIDLLKRRLREGP